MEFRRFDVVEVQQHCVHQPPPHRSASALKHHTMLSAQEQHVVLMLTLCMHAESRRPALHQRGSCARGGSVPIAKPEHHFLFHCWQHAPSLTDGAVRCWSLLPWQQGGELGVRGGKVKNTALIREAQRGAPGKAAWSPLQCPITVQRCGAGGRLGVGEQEPVWGSVCALFHHEDGEQWGEVGKGCVSQLPRERCLCGVEGGGKCGGWGERREGAEMAAGPVELGLFQPVCSPEAFGHHCR